MFLFIAIERDESSLLDGLSSFKEYVKKAKEYGMPGLSMTNHGRIALVDDFYQACKAEDINPIIGCEFYVAHGKYDDKSPENKDRWHITVIAKNNQGVKNLYHLSYLMNKNGFYYKPRIDDDLLFKYKEGLICLSGCAGSEINSHLRDDEGYEYDFDKAVEVAKKFKKEFGDDYYLELQDHPMRSTGKMWPVQERINKDLTKISKLLGIKRVLTADCHYADPEDEEAHEVLLCIGTGHYLSETDRMSLSEFDLSLKDPKVLYERWKDDLEPLQNTLEINNKVHIEFNLEEQAMPEFKTEFGMSMIQYLKWLSYNGLCRRFDKSHSVCSVEECINKLLPLNQDFHGEKFTGSDIIGRLEMELSVVNKINVPGYFLIVQEYINWAKNNGIRVGCGRGSSLSSLMCYALKITEVNPLGIKGFMFERFLNPFRISLPDVDTDFEARRREDVIQHFRDLYGEDHVVGIGVQSTMRSKNAVRDVARVLEYPFDKSLELTKLLPDAEHTGAPKLHEYIMSDEELKKLYNDPDKVCETPEFRERYLHEPEVKKIVDIAIKLEGKQRNHGLHACGTVISPEPIWEYFPTEISNDVMATTVPMHSVELGGVNEKGGLLKIDVLGLSTLDLISDTLIFIKQTKDKDVNIDEVDLEDYETLQSMREGKCKDVFTFSCISGDVKVVTNSGFAKISELYKRQNSKYTVSVDLANGVRKCRNVIKKIVKTGVQDTYLLETENDSAICATKEHYFFSDSGWKKLSELSTGDMVLVAPYKITKGCIVQCSKCGRKRISYSEGSRNGSLCKSCGSWMKKPQYDYLKKEIGKKVSIKLKGRSLQDILGEDDETYARRIERMRNMMKGEKNPMYGKSTHSHGKFREDLGHYVRSSWEADYARMLKYENIDYIYEWKRFELIRKDGSKLTYLPDFYIPSTNTIVEVKGFMRELDKEKIELFQNQYPEFNFNLVRQNEIAEIEFKYMGKIILECPKIPEGFHFEKIRKISFWKTEETYDIMMEGPFHNYIAAGFVVHNSGGMTHALKGLKVDKFSDLVLVNAMYRPGAMDYIDDAINIKFGKKKPRYWFGQEELLKETYGIIAYQEQGMEIAKFMGFTGGESDNMRKALAKKNKGFLDMIFPTFKEKAIKKGFSEKEVNEYWDSLIGFSRYSFNKCLSGDTKLMRKGLQKDQFNPTLEEFYKIQHDKEYAKKTGHLDLHGKYNLGKLGNVQSLYADNRCRPNKLIHVEQAGIQQLYELELEDGRTIKCTAQHTFPTLHNGICELLELTEQDYIFTYGEYDKHTKLFKIPHEDYVENLPKKGERNYPNIKKGNLFGTYNGFQNTGNKYANYIELKDQCKFLKVSCNNCGKEWSPKQKFELHHIDGNHENDDKRNLKWLCNSCHKKAHYQLGRVKVGEKGSLVLPVKVKKITKLGKEMTYSVKVDDPAHNFAIENGIITGNSHAYAYAVVGYQTAWLRTHYPVEYYAAYFNHVSGDKEKLGKAIKHAKLMGIKVLPPSLNHSQSGFAPDKDGNIYYGFSAIKGVGKTGDLIVERRQNRIIKTVKDFFDVYSDISSSKMKALAEAGVFDEVLKTDPLIKKRYILLYNWDEIYKTYKPGKVSKRQTSLFDVEPQLNIIEPPNKVDLFIKSLFKEKELLGDFVSVNPLELTKMKTDDKVFNLIHHPELIKGQKISCIITGIVTRIHKIRTRKGSQMAFLSLEGEDGEYECTVFPSLLDDSQWLKEGIVVGIEGTISNYKSESDYSLIANKIVEQLKA